MGKSGSGVISLPTNLSHTLEAEAKAKRILHIVYPEDLRYNERSSAERVNSNLKDNFGGASGPSAWT